MSNFEIDIEKAIACSDNINGLANNMKSIARDVKSAKTGGISNSGAGAIIERSIQRNYEMILDHAAKADSLSAALKTIADYYRKADNIILNSAADFSVVGSAEENASTEKGTDKRNWWDKFWDWITGKEPDQYDTTTREQEKAADAAMKKELYKVLQDEKYSESNWDNSTLEQRKQILQDYMDEVIKIYGLQKVNSKINWDSSLTYTANSVTWGQYTDGNHTVTINESVLSDRYSTWDSYDLLETISHELRHAYQHEAVNDPTRFMVSKETIDIWKKNFDNYISSSTDYQKYRNQPVEVDARDFQVNRNKRPK